MYIYRPLGRAEGDLRWTQTHHLQCSNVDPIASLSWGSAEELLVGGAQLSLWFVPDTEPPRCIWKQHVANSVALSYLSYDAGLIASFGQHDRLVKIWRRLSYEVDSTRFDISYLSHPAAVTDLRWRKPWHAEQNTDNLLYTFCADSQVRVWAYSDPHSLDVMQLIATIDMNASIQPRRLSVGSMSHRRFAFILDSRDFAFATEKALQCSPSSTTDHALEHLIEIANRNPEICVVLDGLGHMSAWGIENAGYKNKLPSAVFNVALVDGMNISIPHIVDPEADYFHFCVFAGGVSEPSLSILLQSYAGQIDWYDTQLKDFFNTASRTRRVRLTSSWSGHDSALQSTTRNGDFILTWTAQGQMLLWQQTHAALEKRASIMPSEQVVDASVTLDGGCIIVLGRTQLTVFDAKRMPAAVVDNAPLHSSIPSSHLICEALEGGEHLLVVIFVDSTSQSYKLSLSQPNKSNNVNGAHKALRAIEVSRPNIKRPPQTVLRTALRESTSSDATITAVLENKAIQRFRLIYDKETRSVKSTTISVASIPLPQSILAVASESGKLAVIDKSRRKLAIWDCIDGVWEYEHDFENVETIESVTWHSTPSGHLLLAICFTFHIAFIGQTRLLDRDHAEAWIELQDIRTRDFTTHTIDSVCWLADAGILIGAGNQLFALDVNVSQQVLARKGLQHIIPTPTATMFTEVINCTVPAFHPDFFERLVALGYIEAARRLLHLLHRRVKYLSDGDSLPSMLGMSPQNIIRGDQDRSSNANGSAHSSTVNGFHNEPIDHFTREVAESMDETLEKCHLWQLLGEEQVRLRTYLHSFAEVDDQSSSLDANALRYLHALHNSRDQTLPWSAAVFASLSTSQEALVDQVSQFYGGKLTWEAARKSRMFLWLSDAEALDVQLENVARAEYTKHEDRSPVNCSLHYLALRKKSVLQALWRRTIGVREKENTTKLLANNFELPKFKATALKNAYALISKRRFEYAAAWFLLADSLKDAVNVCVHQLKDLQLAIAVARVYGKDDNTVLDKLLSDTVSKQSVESEDGRWMASWAFGMLHHHEKAVQVLVRPVHQVVNVPLIQDQGLPGSQSYRANDPLLTVLYTQLRSRLAKQNKWINVVTPKEEWDFVMRCVRQYLRMGMDVLALDLVRNWEFVRESQPPPPTVDAAAEARAKAMKDAEEAEAEEQQQQQQQAKDEKAKRKPPPTQFVEPTSNSLLDSFGF